MPRPPRPTLAPDFSPRLRQDVKMRMKRLGLKRLDLAEDYDGLPSMSPRTLDDVLSDTKPLRIEQAVELALRYRRAAKGKGSNANLNAKVLRELHAQISRPALIVFPNESARAARAIRDVLISEKSRRPSDIEKTITDFFSEYEEICKTYVGPDLMNRLLSYFGADWRAIVTGKARPHPTDPNKMTTESVWKQFETWIKERHKRKGTK